MYIKTRPLKTKCAMLRTQCKQLLSTKTECEEENVDMGFK